VGLYHFGFAAGEEGLSWDWAVLRAFAEGYGEWVRPMREEVETLPDLMRLRRAVSVIHWAGRWLAGVTPEENLRWQVSDTLALDRWLRKYGDELVGDVRASIHGR
jgi:Ser/Thr protein kinase RdoA (MazF antagonist)